MISKLATLLWSTLIISSCGQTIDFGDQNPSPPIADQESLAKLEIPNPGGLNQQVEIKIGQLRIVDCNRHRMSANIRKVPEQAVYIIDRVGPMLSTRMGCGKLPKSERFIEAYLAQSPFSFSGRSLIVFYPSEFELRYRLNGEQGQWQSSTKAQ